MKSSGSIQSTQPDPNYQLNQLILDHLAKLGLKLSAQTLIVI